jgi:hypothetical protein
MTATFKIGRSAPAHDGVLARYRREWRRLRGVRANLHKKPIGSDSGEPENAANAPDRGSYTL